MPHFAVLNHVSKSILFLIPGPFYYHSTSDGIYKVNARTQEKIRKYFNLDELVKFLTAQAL